MNEQELSLLAIKIVNDTKFWIALIGILGAIVGSLLTLAVNFGLEWFKGRNQRKIDTARQKLLNELLQDHKFSWRSLSVLAAVIGCNEEQTKSHLVAIGARGSEKNDGKWALLSRHPLSEIIRDNEDG